MYGTITSGFLVLLVFLLFPIELAEAEAERQPQDHAEEEAHQGPQHRVEHQLPRRPLHHHEGPWTLSRRRRPPGPRLPDPGAGQGLVVASERLVLRAELGEEQVHLSDVPPFSAALVDRALKYKRQEKLVS